MDLGKGSRARFRALDESTTADWALIQSADAAFDAGHAERVLALLAALESAGTALPVSRLTHSLQTATRAHRNGESEAYVVAALLHDVGEPLMPENHAELGAALMRPYVEEALHFTLRHHAVFQGYHYWHVLGGDRHARDAWFGHPHFAATARFCALYDSPAFDAGYDTLPLAAFEPMLRRVLAAPRAGFDGSSVSLWRRALRRLIRLGR